jgi:plastocyanin
LSGTKDTQSNAGNDNSVSVVIQGINGDHSYSPNPITIEKGQSITCYNGHSISHTVTSGAYNKINDSGKLFDSGAIIPNQSYSITFDNTGNFDYYCIYHPSMVGEIIVR